MRLTRSLLRPIQWSHVSKRGNKLNGGVEFKYDDAVIIKGISYRKTYKAEVDGGVVVEELYEVLTQDIQEYAVDDKLALKLKSGKSLNLIIVGVVWADEYVKIKCSVVQ